MERHRPSPWLVWTVVVAAYAMLAAWLLLPRPVRPPGSTAQLWPPRVRSCPAATVDRTACKSMLAQHGSALDLLRQLHDLQGAVSTSQLARYRRITRKLAYHGKLPHFERLRRCALTHARSSPHSFLARFRSDHGRSLHGLPGDHVSPEVSTLVDAWFVARWNGAFSRAVTAGMCPGAQGLYWSWLAFREPHVPAQLRLQAFRRYEQTTGMRHPRALATLALHVHRPRLAMDLMKNLAERRAHLAARNHWLYLVTSIMDTKAHRP